MEIIRPAQWRTQPWKNGGGITHELAALETLSLRSAAGHIRACAFGAAAEVLVMTLHGV